MKKVIEILKKGWKWGLIVVLLGIEIFLIKDVFGEVERVKNYRLQIQRNINFLRNLASLQKEEKEAEKYLESMRRLLPEEEKIFSLIDDLKRRAKRYDLNTQFQFGDVLKKEKLKWILVNFELQGNLNEIINYFQDLKRAPYFITVDKFSLSKSEEKNLFYLTGKGKIFLKNVK